MLADDPAVREIWVRGRGDVIGLWMIVDETSVDGELRYIDVTLELDRQLGGGRIDFHLPAVDRVVR
jgi:hypothetical protein